jgi:hypothetical protein
MLRRALLACGVVTSLLYLASLVLGPMRWEGYSSTSQTISELYAIGAPSRSLVFPVGVAYDVLLVAFGVGVWAAAGARRGLRVTARMLVAVGALGLFWPPMHLRGEDKTLTDTLHIAWAAAISLLIVLAIAFAARAFGGRFRAYSIATIAVVLGFGALTSVYGPRIGANLPTPGAGIVERVDLGAYLVWVVVLAVALLRAPVVVTPRRPARAEGPVASEASASLRAPPRRPDPSAPRTRTRARA